MTPGAVLLQHELRHSVHSCAGVAWLHRKGKPAARSNDRLGAINIYEKLHVHSKSQAVSTALQERLLRK